MPSNIQIDREAIYTIADAATLCELPLTSVRSAIKNGELSATRRARRTFVQGESLWRWLTGRPQQTDGGTDHGND